MFFGSRVARYTFWVALIAATSFLFAAFGYAGLYAHVLADEWTFSQIALITPLHLIHMPIYLYKMVYAPTLACGDGFLDCVRFINSAFFACSAPFIYLVSRKLLGAALSVVVVAFTLLGPLHSFSAYFMPESMYFFFFWVWVWVSLVYWNDDILGPILSGAVLGLMALVKPHAIFLLPVIAIFGAYRSWSAGFTFRHGFVAVAAGVAAFIVTKFGIGLSVAGTRGLSLFGDFYSSYQDKGASVSFLLGAAPTISRIAAGHIIGICLIATLPVAAVLANLPMILKSDRDAQALVFLVAILGVLVGVTSAFTGLVAVEFAEPVTHLHTRYYGFALPLLVIVGLHCAGQTTSVRTRLLCSLPVAAVAIYAAIRLSKGWSFYSSTGPEFFGVTRGHWAFLVAALSIASTSAWIINPRRGVNIAVLAVLPFIALLSITVLTQSLRLQSVPTVGDRAALVARQFVPDYKSHVMLVANSDDIVEFYRGLFVLNARPVVGTRVLQGGLTKVDVTDVPKGFDWVLTLRSVQLSGAADRVAALDGEFALYRLKRAD